MTIVSQVDQLNVWASRAAFGLELAEMAGEISCKHFDQANLRIDTKGDGSPVTIADREIELQIRESVEGAFPDDAFLGEEFPNSTGTSGFRWIVDPIDGTKSFIYGVPLYANLIALEWQENIVFGVINLPSAGSRVHAEQGGGCWRNGQRVSVSTREGLEGAHVMATWLEDWNPQVIDDLHGRGVVLRTWGDAFGYAMVACGTADAIVDYTTQPYDLAPMPVIISEANGRFTDLRGKPEFTGGNGIASNGLIHDELLALVSPNTQPRSA